MSFHGPNDFDVFVTSADGSGLRSLTREWELDGIPVWSPDGQKIAFRSKRNGNDDIYVMNPDGSGQRNLTRNPATIDARLVNLTHFAGFPPKDVLPSPFTTGTLLISLRPRANTTWNVYSDGRVGGSLR